ncbi:GNAT family N-acetyltransferase [Nocardia mexicana]|uniref:Acetyltransferase (GNAT) family protein n=1 Tax=Nocardia mexicana TaxID=279262 RepID=A0A370H1X7_9NOCA|nr:GNAT family N-acetyltransferase [Nocardia mexicana]RDI50019.1 acetyltransferase (GNAT) family protein [Nocardia mexicana]
MDERIVVRRAGADELDAVAAAYAEANADEAVTTWVLADNPQVTADFAAHHVPDMIAQNLRDDEVWVAGVGEEIWAISLWHTVTSLDRYHAQHAEIQELARTTGLRPFRRLEAVLTAVNERHPTEFPHRYLQSIATVPHRRGSGAGAAILTDRLKAAAAEGLPAYLEASTERSSRLYERCGFVLRGEPIQLPDGGPTLRPMWFQG